MSCTSCQSKDAARKNSDLSIYILGNDYTTKQAIHHFNRVRDKGRIIPRTFFADEYEDYEKQLLYDLSTGAGPDVIVLYPEYLSSISKLLNLNTFYDINELISEDETFNLEDYHQKIMDCGVKDGKRYMLPLSYTVDVYYSTEEILKAHHLNVDSKTLTLNDMLSLAQNFKGQDGDSFMSELPLTGYLSHFVDPVNQITSFDTEDFRNFLDQYKALCQSASNLTEGTQPITLPPEGTVALLSGALCNVDSIIIPFQDFDKAVTNPVLIPYTLSDPAGKIAATPSLLVAINKNSAHKKVAFEFIKTLLSKEEQMNINGAFPVNWEAYEKLKEEGSNHISAYSGGIRDEAVLSRLIARMDEIVKGDIVCRVRDQEAEGIIHDELMEYLNESKPQDTVCRNLQDRVSSNLRGKPTIEAPPSNNSQNALKLTLHYMDYDRYITNAIRIFNERYKDVQIEGTTYASSAIDSYRTMLTTSVMAGEGPDILIYNPNIFNSITKTMKTGAFADLNPLIEKDSSFDSSLYYPEIFNAGVFNNKRCFIPLFYDIPTLVTSKSGLKALGLSSIDSGWTINDLKKALSSYKAENPANGQYFFNSSVNFLLLINSSGIQFVDVESNTTHFQSKAFIELLELAKEMAPLVMPSELEAKLDLPPILLKNNTIRMMKNNPIAPRELAMLNSIYSSVLKDDFVILPLPTLESGAKYPTRLCDVVSINANCQNQQAAFDFIKILLSEDIQRTYDSHGISNLIDGLPINKNAYMKDIEDEKKPLSTTGVVAYGSKDKYLSFTPIPLTETIADTAININGNMGPPIYLDKEVENIIYEGLQSFLKGTRTAEEVAKEIDEKVTLYLNE